MEKLCIVKRRKIGYGNMIDHPIDHPPASDADAASSALSFQLTPEQTSTIAGNVHFRHLLGESTPQVFFNLHFNDPAPTVRLLTVSNVCEMLQLSRTTVRKLVSTAVLPSVKIGRSRRFFLNDIIEYLTTCSAVAPVSSVRRLHADVVIASDQESQAMPN